MSNGKNTGRTVVLSLVVALSLVVLIVVAVLVFGGESSPDNGAATTTVAPSSTTSSTTASTPTTTPTPTSTHTRPTGEPGTVTYQLTGSGDVVGVSYRSGSTMRVVAITGTPWQQKTTVTDRRARLTGIVIRGPITCTIMQGEELLSSSTSSGGPISCGATLPR
ncbi:hypothetical protein JVX90_19755 [Gordonia sp. PDNC005]|uniref:hypothetical protein n=1 Tax=unclassified Gordonia (in: high G+C Gram-positive bacteria) TaxID=2657482 RepID=UPI001966507B|nr:hypothetical protein [Gordonia sp. PDNC005]QRY62569.1 hypothetical protein JVX90_19755 [Gordonia sp. PDNC005]